MRSARGFDAKSEGVAPPRGWRPVLLIRAVSFKGQPLPRDVSARFEESGGTIGRGEHSTLVLPDPERYISRTHATIAFQAGGFVITDNGTKNPVLLNGRPLGTGSQGRLASGDRIKLGDYVLEVALTASATPPAGVGGRISAPAKDDPLAAFGGPAPGGNDPFEDLLRPPARPTPPPPERFERGHLEAAGGPDPSGRTTPAGYPRYPPRPRAQDRQACTTLQAPRSDVLSAEPVPGNPVAPSQPADPFDLLDVLGRAEQSASATDRARSRPRDLHALSLRPRPGRVRSPSRPSQRPRRDPCRRTFPRRPDAVRPVLVPCRGQWRTGGSRVPMPTAGGRRKHWRGSAASRLPPGRGHRRLSDHGPHARDDGVDRPAPARGGPGHPGPPARPRARRRARCGPTSP